MTQTSAARVVVHDFSGHPFQVELARQLAAQGHETTHVHCPSFETPRGNLTIEPDDPPTFRLDQVSTAKPFDKYRAPHRLIQEIEYGWRSGRRIGALRPDVVISANVPLLAALVFQVLVRLRRIPVVFWQQDIYSVAMAGHLERQVPVVGKALGALMIGIEKFLLRSSAEVVTISPDFLPVLDDWGIDGAKITVVENWAPLAELPTRPTDNPWRTRHGLDGETVLVYSGTLGLKHDPSLLLALAEELDRRGDGVLVVASEGRGARWLETNGAHLASLRLLGFQPYDELPDMLGTADVLIALLEPDAGVFSVPSKILTYHCAGRALLAAIPDANLAARMIRRESSGTCTPPGDHAAFVAGAVALLDDDDARVRAGQNARAYAERTFDIDDIGRRFEDIIGRVRSRAPGRAESTRSAR